MNNESINNTHFDFNINHANPWTKLSIGAKAATILVGLAVAAASLAASIFFAGAALFAALVMAIFHLLSGNKDAKDANAPIEGEAVVKPTETSV